MTKNEYEDIRMYVWEEVYGLDETDDYCHHVFLHVVDRMVRTSESREEALAYCLKHPEPFEQPFGD